MKVKRKIIQIDEERCDGCGQCVPSCAEGALEIVDGKVRMIAEKYCDGLGACLGDCPNDALHVIERDAEEFDEDAVEEHLTRQEKQTDKPMVFGGCPSSRLQTFTPGTSPVSPTDTAPGTSALTHWPVQIMLVPPTAPFLKGADLLVVADCAPLAYPDFHRDFLAGKAVMMGCPKFDNIDLYVEKFADIFRQSGIQSVTAVIMEVPCCSALPMVVRKGMELAKTQIPFDEVIIGTRGQLVERRKIA